MINFMLLGKAKEVFSEMAFMLRLQKATGQVLMRYHPDIDAYSQN